MLILLRQKTRLNGVLKNCVVRSLSTTKNVEKSNHYDIVIAGGGMVGSTLACALGKNQLLSNRRILLLEGSPQKDWKLPEKYTNRVSSLNPGTCSLLKSVGAWEHIEKSRMNPVKQLQVWDALSDAVITFDQDNKIDPVAYIVENDVLLAGVQKELQQIANVDISYQSKINKYDLPSATRELCEIHLDNGTKYTCNLLLGCDGAKSKVREAMGTTNIAWEYNNMSVVATLTLQEDFDENSTAWQRFLPSSEVIALLPLTKNQSSLVWGTSFPKAKELLSMPEEEFISQLNHSLTKDYPKSVITEQGTKFVESLLQTLNFQRSTLQQQIPPKIVGLEGNSRAGFPLGFGHATNYISTGVALVGDAAHRVHPLAGQGVNLGFGDVTTLNRILSEAVETGRKIESLSTLRHYETERQRANIPTMLTVDGLFRIFSTQLPPIVLLRSLGMQTLNTLTPFKKLIMSQASGEKCDPSSILNKHV